MGAGLQCRLINPDSFFIYSLDRVWFVFGKGIGLAMDTLPFITGREIPLGHAFLALNEQKRLGMEQKERL